MGPSGPSYHPPPGRSSNGNPGGNAEKRIGAAIKLTSKLRALLSTPEPSEIPRIEALADEITSHIDSLYACQQTYRPGISGDADIDSLGTELWNLCARLGRLQKAKRPLDLSGAIAKQAGPIGSLERLTICGRTLAFHLLAIARPRENGPFDVVAMIRLLKLALKLVGVCVDTEYVKMGGQVLQMAADYKGWLQEMTKDLPEEEAKECQCLEVEYFIMRTAMCAVEKRFDVAEHMYTKSEHLHKFLTPEYAGRLGGILLDIGRTLSDLRENKAALKWYNRALDVMNTQEPEKLSREDRGLRLVLFQTLVGALLFDGSPENLERASNLIHYIEAEKGEEYIVSLLKLELLIKTPAEVFDSEGYADALRHTLRHFINSDSGVKLGLSHIRKLHDKSPGAGCAVMDDFITLLGGTKHHEWLEKAVVTRMWMITSQRDSLETINTVKSVLGCLKRPLSAEAAVAAQALLWKKLEINYGQGQYELAESWCQLGLHDTFENCGTGNKSKLERKLLMCALAKNSLQDATSALGTLSPQSWREPMTAYLAFKVAIRVEARDLAEKCLETVAQAPDHVDYLGACIAESQKTGDISCALSALKTLQERYEYKEPNPIHLPALFRCTIRLLNLLVERQGEDTNGVVHDLCEVFDAVVLALERQEEDTASGRKLFTVDELEWFSRNAYNLALKNTASWELRSVVRMLTACIAIIGHFPSDAGFNVELSLKTLFSRFVISSALVSLARTQDNVEQQRQDYLSMRRHIADFDGELQEYLPQSDEQSKSDMLRKHATLLAFDFEAAVTLQEWDNLGSVVQRAVPCRNVPAFQAMADCLLRAKAPGQVLYSNMRKLVNEIWALETFDAVKLAKYTRCLFQATLPLNDSLAMDLLDEACVKARELHENPDAPWPENELEWMATTAFNHAIDCYGARETEQAKAWATKAINLAHYCRDGGGLEGVLQEKYMRLSLDGEGVSAEADPGAV